MTKIPYNGSFTKATRVLETVHLDTVGPLSITSVGGSTYFLTIVDQYSGFKVVKFMKNKSETYQKFVDFIKTAKNQTEVKLKNIISDNGTEFKNANFSNYCKEFGVFHHFSPAYTP